MIYLIVATFVALAIPGVFLLFRRRSTELGSDSEDVSDRHYDYDVAIVGSGVLGSAMAAVLGRDGRKVVVVERDLRMPERFAGELLQPGGLSALRELGLQDCVKDIDAQNMRGYEIYGRDGTVRIELPYPMDSEGIGGLTLNNGRFVMNLRRAAMAEKNVTYVEGSVTSLIESGGAITGVACTLKDDDSEKTIRARLTVVTDGCFSQLRKNFANRKPKYMSSFLAGMVRNRPDFRSPLMVFLLADPNPVVVYSIDSESIRVLVDMREKVPSIKLEEYFKEKVCPQLPERYREIFVEGMTSVSIRSLPNSRMPAVACHKRGALILGDALNLRHPITASGMTVALADLVILRKLLSAVRDLSDHARMAGVSREFFRKRMRHSFVLNSLANLMFEILVPKDEWMVRLQNTYLEYVSRNSWYVKDVVELLSSLDTRASSLLVHLFYAVAYVIWLPLKGGIGPSLFRRSYASIRVMGTICKTLVPLLWAEWKTTAE